MTLLSENVVDTIQKLSALHAAQSPDFIRAGKPFFQKYREIELFREAISDKNYSLAKQIYQISAKKLREPGFIYQDTKSDLLNNSGSVYYNYETFKFFLENNILKSSDKMSQIYRIRAEDDIETCRILISFFRKIEEKGHTLPFSVYQSFLTNYSCLPELPEIILIHAQRNRKDREEFNHYIKENHLISHYFSNERIFLQEYTNSKIRDPKGCYLNRETEIPAFFSYVIDNDLFNGADKNAEKFRNLTALNACNLMIILEQQNKMNTLPVDPMDIFLMTGFINPEFFFKMFPDFSLSDKENMPLFVKHIYKSKGYNSEHFESTCHKVLNTDQKIIDCFSHSAEGSNFYDDYRSGKIKYNKELKPVIEHFIRCYEKLTLNNHLPSPVKTQEKISRI